MVDRGVFTVGVMHEGKKLVALIEGHKLNKVSFGKACGVGPSAVQKMVNADEWKPGMWATIVSGLDKLGIDPQELRPSTTAFRERPAADMRPMVDTIPVPALRTVRDLLAAGDRERQRVLDYLDGLLKSGK